MLPHNSSHLTTATAIKSIYHQTPHTSAHASVTQATSSSLSLQRKGFIAFSLHLSRLSHTVWLTPSA